LVVVLVLVVENGALPAQSLSRRAVEDEDDDEDEDDGTNHAPNTGTLSEMRARGRQLGESLVLPGLEAGQLAHHRLVPGSVVVPSTDLPDAPNRVIYRAGQDYQVDDATGQIRRVAGSRIPDYRRNSLFGQKDFDHTRFPGFGNYHDFVYVDYGYLD